MSIRVYPWLTQRNAFRRALLGWYSKHGRDLPWRHTRDPYAILLSEVMLQQTQVATVLPYYRQWLRRFPDFVSLANASESEVLHAWQGLGYYARARHLHATAKAIAANGGSFPASIEEMRRLPGLGRYTAHAVATFALDQSVPIVEANIARLLARLIDLRRPIDSSAGIGIIWGLAQELLPKSNAHAHNSALMDLGALVCVARQPRCGVCPVRTFCRAVDPAKLPIKKRRAPLRRLTEHHSLSLHRGRILLEQSKDRWRGLWILPRLPEAPAIESPLYSAEFPFTHHRITLAVYRQRTPPARPVKTHAWFPIDSVASIPLPSPHRRAVAHLIAQEPQMFCSTGAAS